jgi:hypothetical protein
LRRRDGGKGLLGTIVGRAIGVKSRGDEIVCFGASTFRPPVIERLDSLRGDRAVFGLDVARNPVGRGRRDRRRAGDLRADLLDAPPGGLRKFVEAGALRLGLGQIVVGHRRCRRDHGGDARRSRFWLESRGRSRSFSRRCHVERRDVGRMRGSVTRHMAFRLECRSDVDPGRRQFRCVVGRSVWSRYLWSRRPGYVCGCLGDETRVGIDSNWLHLRDLSLGCDSR